MKYIYNRLINSDDNKRLVANFFSLAILRGFQFIIPLITLPYLVRTIGVEKFGLINFSLSFCLYFGAIIQFGFGITATRDIARYRGETLKLAKIYSTSIIASILLAVASSVIFSIMILSFDIFNENLSLYLFSFIFVVFQNLFPVWFFQGIEKMKYIAFLTLFTNLILLISLFYFVKEENDYILVPLLQAFSVLLNFILAIVIIKKQFKVCFIVPTLHDLKSVYINGHYAFITQFVPNIYANSAVFLLGVFSNNTAVGLFSAATKVIDAFGSIVYIFSNTFLPFLSRSISKHAIFKKLMFAVGVGVAATLLIFSNHIAILMYGDIDKVVVKYIQILSLAIPLIFTQITYGQSYLMLIGKEHSYKNIVMVSSFFSLVYSIPAIYFYGPWGAIFSLIFTRVVISFCTLKVYFKHAQVKA